MTEERIPDQPMTDQRWSGFALIAGSVASIITMAFHPTVKQILAPEALHSTMQIGIAVHALALISLPVSFMGATGLSKRLAAGGRWSFAGLTFYGFALMAVMNAAVMSGLVAPGLARRIIDGGDGNDVWQMLFHYTGELNQAFALVFVVASSMAIVLWSVAILKGGFRARGTAIYGCLSGPIILLAALSGHVRLNVHGFGAIMLAESVWMTLMGVWLVRAA